MSKRSDFVNGIASSERVRFTVARLTENRSGLIGKAVDRYEGPLKVTGTAPYAYEVEAPEKPVHGVLVTSSIARGRIASVDTKAAEASPGVLLVWPEYAVEVAWSVQLRIASVSSASREAFARGLSSCGSAT